MRGKLSWVAIQIFSVGITPADAGKTLSMSIYFTALRDHPRRCGENENADLSGLVGTGSPPQMRGKLSAGTLFSAVSRITPAGAGKTVKQCLFNELT